MDVPPPKSRSQVSIAEETLVTLIEIAAAAFALRYVAPQRDGAVGDLYAALDALEALQPAALAHIHNAVDAAVAERPD